MVDSDVEGFGGGAPPFNFKQAISQMVQRGASDLLKVGRPPSIGVNGELVPLNVQALRPEELKNLAEQIMTPRQIKEFAEKKEADFAIGVPGVVRFRTNIYQQRGTLAFALRAIPYEVKALHELNLPEVLEEISLKPRGLVLVKVTDSPPRKSVTTNSCGPSLSTAAGTDAAYTYPSTGRMAKPR